MTISNPSLTQISQALAEMLPKLKPLSVPTGMISAFHTVPEGWLQCNGAAVSRTTYAALFAVVGTKYGSGDGSTTFNLPNLHRNSRRKPPNSFGWRNAANLSLPIYLVVPDERRVSFHPLC